MHITVTIAFRAADHAEGIHVNSAQRAKGSAGECAPRARVIQKSREDQRRSNEGSQGHEDAGVSEDARPESGDDGRRDVDSSRDFWDKIVASIKRTAHVHIRNHNSQCY